jgi:hypothetical protein
MRIYHNTGTLKMDLKSKEMLEESAENPIVNISVKHNDIIRPNSGISVSCNIPLDSKYVERSIQLKGVPGNVTLDESHKLAMWKALSPIKEGYYVFEVNELIFEDGRKQKGGIEISIIVLDSNQTIPADMSIHAVSRISLEGTAIKRLPLGIQKDDYFEFIKASDRQGKPVELAYDESGNKVDPKMIVDNIARQYMEKYGKVHESLYKALNSLEKDQRIEVAIWIKTDEVKQFKNKTVKDREEDIQFSKRVQEKLKSVAKKISNSIKIDNIRIDSVLPVLYATVSKDQVPEVTKEPDVERIFLYEKEGILDLQDSINVAQSEDVHDVGVTGANVRVAIWEDGPDNTANLVVTNSFSATPSTSTHARLTTCIVRNNQTIGPHGHAPGCNIYSANTMGLDALTWAVKSQGCTVVSQSFHRSAEETSSTLSFDDISKDWLVLNWPYPTILQAAGNGSATEFVNHKGFNSLAVGNHNDNANSMEPSSVFKNPTSLHGDRELPELCANGTGVTGCGLTMTGTSFAAPAVAGIVALIQEADTTLQLWPEGCRAILLATARRNVVDTTWWNDILLGIDGKDGAGAANGYFSYLIAENRVQRGGIRLRGWDVGTLLPSDFDTNGMATFTYRVKTPQFSLSRPKVKVALAWDSVVSPLPSVPFSFLAVDLDLLIFDDSNNIVASSSSWENSYEIAEFIAEKGKTYTIKIRRWSGNSSTWFGIAWNVEVFGLGESLPWQLNSNTTRIIPF